MKPSLWPRTWEKLERKGFYCGSRSGWCCYLQKDGKNLDFPPGSALAGDGWEERWICAEWGCSWLCVLCLGLCWGMGDLNGGEVGLGWWHHPTNPSASQKASQALSRCGMQATADHLGG